MRRKVCTSASSDVRRFAVTILAHVGMFHAAGRVRDFVNCAVAEGRHIKIAVRTGNDVGDNAKILTGDQAFAFALVKLVIIVIDSIAQFGIVEGKVLPAMVELELKQIATIEESA